MKTCKHCGKLLTGRQTKYCSKECNSKNWNKNNPEKVREWNKNNPESVKKSKQNWKEEHPNYDKKYYQDNKESFEKRNKKFKENNPNHHNLYMKKRRKNDINFRILHNLRTRINIALKLNQKSKRTEQLLGCTIPELKIYLKIFFKPNMNWDNYGTWHIDHVIPCCRFNLENPKQQKICFHFSNLQPLWAVENLRKGGK